jgi:hypothetical protein
LGGVRVRFHRASHMRKELAHRLHLYGRLFPAIKAAVAVGLGVATCGLFLPSQSLAQASYTLCARKSGEVTFAKKGKCGKGSTTLPVGGTEIQGGLQLVDSNGTVVGPLYPGLNGASGPSTVVQINGSHIQLYLLREGSDFFNPPNTGSGVDFYFADSNCATQPLLPPLGGLLAQGFVSNGVVFYSQPSQATSISPGSTCSLSPPSTRGDASSMSCGGSCLACTKAPPIGPPTPSCVVPGPMLLAPAQAASLSNFVPPFSIQ